MSSDRADLPQSLPAWLSYLERIHPHAIDMGLDRVAAVRDRLGIAPFFPVVMVAGTNGKGSVCAMLESILSAAGYRVGLYTSPHLLRYNERVRVAGREVSDGALVEAFDRIERARAGVSLTYFEFGTLAAMLLFADARIEVAVLEVGLGGRLDAVNAFDADCAVVTSVDLDHLEYLGPDRESVGREKAGIFRAGRPAVCGDAEPPATLLAHANEVGARLFLVGRDFGFSVQSGQWQYWSTANRRSALPCPALRGAYQIANAATALMALEQVRDRLPVDMGAIRRGLLDIELPGRFQVLPGLPMVILDVGHNPHAARGLAASLRALPKAGRTFAIFAMLGDKDIDGVVAAVSGEIDEWLVAGLPAPRGAGSDRMFEAVASAGVSAPVARFDTPAQAYERVLEVAGRNDRILVFGSFYTVGAVLQARKRR